MELVYEAAGASALAFQVLPHLSRNGVMVLTGVPRGGAAFAIDGDELMTGTVVRNAMVVGTVNAGREDFTAAIEHLGVFLDAWPEAVRGIVTGRHALDDFCNCAVAKGGDGIKEIIELARP